DVLLAKREHVIKGTTCTKDPCQPDVRAALKPCVETPRGVRENEEWGVGNRIPNVNLPERNQPVADSPANAVCPVHQHGASAEAAANTRHRDPGRNAGFVVEDVLGKTQQNRDGGIADSMTGKRRRSATACSRRSCRYKVKGCA